MIGNVHLGYVALAFAAGAAIAVVHFGGLWLTVNRLLVARHPSALATLSFLARMTVTVAGLVMVTSGEWYRLVAAVAGFLVVRLVLARLWGPSGSIEAERGKTARVREAR